MRRRGSRRLKVLIIEAGETQRSVAEICGITESRLSDLANGRAEPREAERQALAAVLGRSPEDLFVAARP